MTKEEKAERRKKFTSEWIRMGMITLAKADRLGIDWEQVGVWNLQTHVKFIENLGEPQEERLART
jgi:hypothetical protein